MGDIKTIKVPEAAATVLAISQFGDQVEIISPIPPKEMAVRATIGKNHRLKWKSRPRSGAKAKIRQAFKMARTVAARSTPITNDAGWTGHARISLRRNENRS